MKAHLLGLTVSCPHNLCNPEDCPLCEIRMLAMRERFQWVESLPASEVEPLLHAHCLCLQKKVAADLAPAAGEVASVDATAT